MNVIRTYPTTDSKTGKRIFSVMFSDGSVYSTRPGDPINDIIENPEYWNNDVVIEVTNPDDELIGIALKDDLR